MCLKWQVQEHLVKISYRGKQLKTKCQQLYDDWMRCVLKVFKEVAEWTASDFSRIVPDFVNEVKHKCITEAIIHSLFTVRDKS